jgi:hypothetical protein
VVKRLKQGKRRALNSVLFREYLAPPYSLLGIIGVLAFSISLTFMVYDIL